MADDHLLDETISAVLDGEATPAEARHAAECPLCGARLQEFRRAASVIGSTVAPVTDAGREAAIARAVGARVEPLPRRQLPLGWLAGAAAALVALALAIPIVNNSGGGDDDSVASKGAPDVALESSGGGAAADTAAGPVALGDLGAVDATELQVRVRDALSPNLASTTTARAQRQETALAAPATGSADTDTSACTETFARNSPDFGTLRATGNATFNGRAATVLAFESADGRILVFAVASDACDEILVSVTFPAP